MLEALTDRLVRGVLDVLDHTIKVKTDSVLVVVPVLLDVKPGILEDGGVVSPRGRWEIHRLVVLIPSLKVSSSNSESASARDRLGHSDATFLERSGVRTVGQHGSTLGEFREASDGEILFVVLLGHDPLFSLTNSRKHMWLALRVAVGPHAADSPMIC